MKKLNLLIIMVLLPTIIFSACNSNNVSNKAADDGKLKIVATLFPQYDFARQIAGDNADITLLLPPGADSHSYDPTPSDIITIQNADLFIYTGEYMEPWAQTIINSIDKSSVRILDVSADIELISTADEQHEDGHNDYLHKYDPHIWTSPLNAIKMAVNIANALIEIDGANAEYYKQNLQEYTTKLTSLDSDFRTVVNSGKHKTIYLASHSAIYYFGKEYGLEIKSVYDTTVTSAEPSVKSMAAIIDEMKANNISVIYYQELESTAVAKAISSETGAQVLLFHSRHNVSKADFEAGATYLSLMEKNVENLKTGLN